MIFRFTTIAMLIGLFSLSACHRVNETVEEVDVYLNGERPQPKTIILESRYCYKARADILCYDQPIVGKEHQLIGAQ